MRPINKPDPKVLAKFQECCEETRRDDLNTPEQKAWLKSSWARRAAEDDRLREAQPRQLELAA